MILNKIAFLQAYHQAKRDFNADSAWQYYAGALEMAAMAAFMLGTSNRKTYDYMEEAIVTYLNICRYEFFISENLLFPIYRPKHFINLDYRNSPLVPQ